MPSAWIAAWKALLSRVAERFVAAQGPVEPGAARRVPPLQRAGTARLKPAHAAPTRHGPPHRSGQRHG